MIDDTRDFGVVNLYAKCIRTLYYLCDRIIFIEYIDLLQTIVSRQIDNKNKKIIPLKNKYI